MTTRREWTIESDDIGWYLQWWLAGEFWSNKTTVRLSGTKFEDAIVEARIILNLD
jgi:hypothetical protein